MFVPGALWLREYGVRLGGARFNARMTVIRLRSGEVVELHANAHPRPPEEIEW